MPPSARMAMALILPTNETEFPAVAMATGTPILAVTSL